MSGIQQLLLGGSPAGYQIERSLRFNSADSAYLNRTTTSTVTSNTTWSFSAWLKIGSQSTSGAIFETSSSGTTGIPRGGIRWDSANALELFQYNGTSYDYRQITTQVFRDPSAWYHIVVVADTSNGTAANRMKLYVNNVQVTSWSTNTQPSSGLATYIGSASKLSRIGVDTYNGSSSVFDGYLTEINFIDGQSLTPSSFGQSDPNTGVWSPIKYTGTYGTNGFYLNFSDNSNTTAATLGKDSSGNGNNWTPNNFSVTAGVGNDSLVDTPTSYGTDTGVGGEVRGNYATLNPLDYYSASSGITFSEGNLKQVSASNADEWPGKGAAMPFAVYCEGTIVGTPSSTACVGIYPINQNVYGGASANLCGYSATSYALRFANGNKYNNNSSVAYGSAFAANDVWMMAFDPVAGKIWWGKNGTWFGSGDPAAGTNAAFTGITGDKQFGYGTYPSGTGFYVNFGQRPFAYTAPSGFKALCTQNLPTPTIGATSTTQANDYFNAVLYTGDGTANRSVTGVGFQPDLVWAKARSAAYYNGLFDNLRSGRALYSNATDAEDTTEVVAFDSDGFTTPNKTGDFINTNSATYVAWNWKANGAGSSNTQGTITSTVSANTTAGFSIVTYTGTGVAATVGHGIGVAPSMLIIKRRSSAEQWAVYHASLGKDKELRLDTTNAAGTSTVIWNNTNPTSTVFSIGAPFDLVNTNGSTYVAYCFAEVAGYSAFGSYSGNNSSTDGPFVYLGFRPRFIMIKSTSAGTDWVMMDSARNTYNLADTSLYANSANSESTIGTVNDIDFLSNGFKLRNNTGFVNASQTYVYAAFAKNPFKYSLAR